MDVERGGAFRDLRAAPPRPRRSPRRAAAASRAPDGSPTLRARRRANPRRLGAAEKAQRHRGALDRHRHAVGEAQPRQTKHRLAQRDVEHHRFFRRRQEGSALDHPRRGREPAQPHVLGETRQPRQRLLDMRRTAPHEGARAVRWTSTPSSTSAGDGAPERGARDVEHLGEFALAGQKVRLREAPARDFRFSARADAREQRRVRFRPDLPSLSMQQAGYRSPSGPPASEMEGSLLRDIAG